jgi:DnaJ-like protein
MGLLDQWVEDRIRAAVARGEFQGLPGEGRPLQLDDDLLVPPELRMAYRILRNAGAVPPELATLREANDLAIAAAGEVDEGRRRAALGRLEALLFKLEAAGLPQISNRVLARYQQQLLERLAGEPGARSSPKSS